MRSRYQVIKNNGVYFITSTIIEWIPVFTNREYFDIIVQSLSYCRQNKGLKLFAYVVMDNHVHFIASADKVSQIVKDFKSFTAREIIKTAKIDGRKWLLNQFEYYKKKYKNDSEYQVWQEGFHPQMIMGEDVFMQKVEYIHHNPIKRGFVEQAEHWVYSSARNYSTGDGCIPQFQADFTHYALQVFFCRLLLGYFLVFFVNVTTSFFLFTKLIVGGTIPPTFKYCKILFRRCCT